MNFWVPPLGVLQLQLLFNFHGFLSGAILSDEAVELVACKFHWRIRRNRGVLDQDLKRGLLETESPHERRQMKVPVSVWNLGPDQALEVDVSVLPIHARQHPERVDILQGGSGRGRLFVVGHSLALDCGYRVGALYLVLVGDENLVGCGVHLWGPMFAKNENSRQWERLVCSPTGGHFHAGVHLVNLAIHQNLVTGHPSIKRGVCWHSC